MKNWMQIILATTFVFSGLGCGKAGSTKSNQSNAVPQGGQDMGGGNTLLSSPEQVNQALDVALDLFTKMNHPGHVRLEFISIILQLKKSKYADIAQKVFYPKGWPPNFSRAANGGLWPSIGDYLYKSKIERRMKGSCPSSDNKHADASVSAHKIGADICFSIENLQRLPEEMLLLEITSLLAHEAAHLVGLGEDDAKTLQILFKNELYKIGWSYPSDQIHAAIKSRLMEAKSHVQLMIKIFNKDPNSPRLNFLAASAVRNLSVEMPYFKYPELFSIKYGEYRLLRGTREAVMHAVVKLFLRFDGDERTFFDIVMAEEMHHEFAKSQYLAWRFDKENPSDEKEGQIKTLFEVEKILEQVILEHDEFFLKQKDSQQSKL